MWKVKMHLHFNRLIPIYNVPAERKRFDINYMDIAFVRSNIKPFTSNR